ncbi:MAG: hypothetical protein ACXWCV_15525 [Caldimonas sp.]
MQMVVEAQVGVAYSSGGGGPQPIEAGDEAAFLAMHSAYRPTGGLARGDDLARLLADRARGDYFSLARLIVAGEVFGFEWQRSFWVPMFQFDLGDLSIKQGLRQVLAELASEFDGWRLAAWFVESNAWLDAARPIDLIDSDPSEVVQAARADRFVAAG